AETEVTQVAAAEAVDRRVGARGLAAGNRGFLAFVERTSDAVAAVRRCGGLAQAAVGHARRGADASLGSVASQTIGAVGARCARRAVAAARGRAELSAGTEAAVQRDFAQAGCRHALLERAGVP